MCEFLRKFTIREDMSDNPFPNEYRLIENYERRRLIGTMHSNIA